MISADRDALICDLAETYGIYDYRSLPVQTVATLSAGLRNNSRIKSIMLGHSMTHDTDVLLGYIYDRLTSLMVYLGAYKKEQISLVEQLTGSGQSKTKKANKPVRAFRTAEEFRKAMSKYEET